LFSLTISAFSRQPDYKTIFGKDWNKAEQFLSENEAWMKQMASRYRISYPLVVAVIFPELVRYSAIRDKIEITLLKTLYINLGSEYSDFSIGPFQMKPSFAEFICSKAETLRAEPGNWFRRRVHKENTWEFRKSIVMDLENADTQFLYLAAFIKICERNYNLEESDETEKVKILSSAYNCGPDKSLEKVKEMADRKFFNTKLYKTENYSYSDVSLYWYKAFTAKP
jgi:hypothetical protein